MADRSLLGEAEIGLLRILIEEDVPFLVVGLAAAALQGAPAVTQDVDLWFGELGGDRFLRALRSAGVAYIPPGPENPPLLAGEGADLIDIVVAMHGLREFQEEYERALTIVLDGVPLRVLPLERIIASKQVLGRPKDRAILPVLRDALETIRRLS